MVGGLEDGRLTRRPEVGGGPDSRAPPVGVWREKENGWGCGTVGPGKRAGPRARVRPAAWLGCGLGKKERELGLLG
jgi:hypothetical protein